MSTPAGIIFIPCHLAEYCVIDAEKSHVRDIWGFIRLDEHKYTAAQIDSTWEPEMWEDFCQWFPDAPEAKDYQHLDFIQELAEARSGNSGKPPAEKRQENTRW